MKVLCMGGSEANEIAGLTIDLANKYNATVRIIVSPILGKEFSVFNFGPDRPDYYTPKRRATTASKEGKQMAKAKAKNATPVVAKKAAAKPAKKGKK